MGVSPVDYLLSVACCSTSQRTQLIMTPPPQARPPHRFTTGRERKRGRRASWQVFRCIVSATQRCREKTIATATEGSLGGAFDLDFLTSLTHVSLLPPSIRLKRVPFLSPFCHSSCQLRSIQVLSTVSQTAADVRCPLSPLIAASPLYHPWPDQITAK